MDKIIREMIKSADMHHDYELAGFVYDLLSKFAHTDDCPSNWWDLGEKLADDRSFSDWAIENCKLYDFK